MRRTITKSEQDAIRAKVLGGYTADADDPSLQYLAEHDDEPITAANYLAIVQSRAAEAEALVYEDGSPVPLAPEQETQAWARDFVREFRHPDHHGRGYFSDD
jgi:hypothetical protein